MKRKPKTGIVRRIFLGIVLHFSMLISLLLPLSLNAQLLEDLESPYVSQTFTGTRIINAQTSEMIPEKGYLFQMQHRFGAIRMDKSFYKEFLGMDLISNIRLALAIPVNRRLYFGIGRTKIEKTIDFEGKYLLLRQRRDNKMPVSLAIYGNAALRTDDFKEVDSTAFFTDSITPFRNKFAHRLGYNAQLIISRKFSERFSLQVSPTIIYENLASAGRENMTFALPISARFKYGTNSAIILEYALVFNNRPANNLNPVSIGVEFGTVGHVFQFFISSSNSILERQLYVTESTDYNYSEFLFGFNIKRVFWRKKTEK